MLHLPLQRQPLTVDEIRYGERKSRKNCQDYRLGEIHCSYVVTRSCLWGDCVNHDKIREEDPKMQSTLSNYRQRIIYDIHTKCLNIKAMTVFLNLVQESQEIPHPIDQGESH